MIGLIVQQLKTYCPSLENRIAGSLNFDIAKPGVKLATPSAIVVYTGDDAEANQIETGVAQNLTERFDVVLVLANRDEQGVLASDMMYALRKEIWRALVGWGPDDDYEPITYVDGELLHLDRASMFYRLSFEVETLLGHFSFSPVSGDIPETWHEMQLAGLPQIESMSFGVDVIGPIANPRPGPDGRIEFEIKETL